MWVKILFVCLGNICRSSAAEEILRQKLKELGKDKEFFVDSAGLIDYHEGEKSDSRMLRHAFSRGYRITHRSRPISIRDFHEFDWIIGMDNNNIRQLRQMAKGNAELCKIHKMTEFSHQYSVDSIPDPYYGSDSDFEYVLDLLEDACDGLIAQL